MEEERQYPERGSTQRKKRKENAGAAHVCLGRPQAGGGGALRNEQQSDSNRHTPRTFNKVRQH
ncbi:hypothetical protein F442_14277 [Phytophthora nicotianae P10297]|uniref:Uncharacterized protein n=1 Tax=Phytophthora nicotianae P10297 TaxID=1317064 RepID=W2YSI1_PHYNI|nr:hypothetical protein F442_14277 [Phytophthora nicotianae P10297]